MKYFIGLFIAFLSGAASTWLFIDEEKTLRGVISKTPIKMEKRSEHLAMTAELSDEMKKLKQENTRLIDTINSIVRVNNTEQSEHDVNSTDSNLVEQELSSYKLNEISANLIEKIGGNLQSYADEISSDFINEKKDIFWSEQEELKLRTVINQDADLSGIAVREIECKTSQCKISVFSGNAEQNQEIFEKLTKSISKQYQNPSYYSNPLENNGVKTIYFKVM